MVVAFVVSAGMGFGLASAPAEASGVEPDGLTWCWICYGTNTCKVEKSGGAANCACCPCETWGQCIGP